MTVKLLTEQLKSLIGDCTGLSESILLKIPHCWKSHAPLKVFIYFYEKARQSRLRIVSEYDQEIPQSQTADNPVAPRGRAARPSRDTRKTN